MSLHHEPLSLAVSLRRDIMRRAVDIFRGWSYRDIEVPLLDYIERPGPERGEQPPLSKRTFQLVDREGNAMSLRADVTPAVAKLFARHLHRLPQPLRVCYANRVVRAERALGRQQSESHQIGVEFIGEAGMIPELEVLLVCLETLEAIGIHDYQLNLGSLAVYRRLLDKTGLPINRREAIDKAVFARDPFEVREILHRSGTRAHIAQALEVIASLRDGELQIRTIRELMPTDPVLEAASEHIARQVEVLGALGYGERLNIDLGDLTGPEYYTGMTFKIVSERVGRQLGGGGRYDQLCASFGVGAPAVGFSLHLDALIECLQTGQSQVVMPTAGSAVRIDPDDPLPGLQDALERRRHNQTTRLVPRRGAAPLPRRS